MQSDDNIAAMTFIWGGVPILPQGKMRFIHVLTRIR